MMKDKKGMLLGEHTLKLVMAILGILILLFLLFKMYDSFMRGQELKQAQLTIKDVEEGLKRAEEDGISELVVLYPPHNYRGYSWEMFGWPIKQSGTVSIPETCVRNGWKDCICICSSPYVLATMNARADSCDTGGVCIGTGDVYAKSNIAPVGDVPYIVFENTPFDLQIKYLDNKFTLTRK